MANAYPAELVYESIYDFIDQLVEDSWPLANSFFPADPSLVIQAIVHGMAIMVTNGSYKPLLLTKIGAAAWILEYLETRMRNKVNPYQSEVQGCHVGLLGLLSFVIYHQIHGRSVDFHFDNDAYLNQSAANNLNVTMKLKHGDLIQAIYQIVHKLKVEHSIRIQFVKVKGGTQDQLHPLHSALSSQTTEQTYGYPC